MLAIPALISVLAVVVSKSDAMKTATETPQPSAIKFVLNDRPASSKCDFSFLFGTDAILVTERYRPVTDEFLVNYFREGRRDSDGYLRFCVRPRNIKLSLKDLDDLTHRLEKLAKGHEKIICVILLSLK